MSTNILDTLFQAWFGPFFEMVTLFSSSMLDVLSDPVAGFVRRILGGILGLGT